MNAEQRRDLKIAPVCEGALILVASIAAWLAHQPLIFASLGPTAYELIETPHRKSARPYNIFVGHLIGVMVGFASLAVTHAWRTPSASGGDIQFARVAAAVLSAAMTVFLTLLVRAAQPAAVATTLLISLGMMQQWRDALIIMAAVLVMMIVGEPLRRWRLGHIPDEKAAEKKG